MELEERHKSLAELILDIFKISFIRVDVKDLSTIL